MPTRSRSSRQLLALGSLTVAVLFGPGGVGGSLLEGSADPVPEHWLYVCIQDDASIAVVDMEAHEIVSLVRLEELGFGARAGPHDVAVAPDGRHWYVSLVGEHRVLRFDEENRLVGSLEMETPGMLRLAPMGDLLAITRSMSAVNPPRLVGLADTASMELQELDVLLPRPHALAIGLDGRFAYTASLGTNQVAAIDLGSDRVAIREIPGTPHAFVQMARSPDGATLVGSGELSGELIVFRLEDPSDPRPLTSIPLGSRPFDPVFSPDGQTVWVPLKGSDEVVVVETRDWSVSARIGGDGIYQPHAVEFSPDGETAFVTNAAPDPDGRRRIAGAVEPGPAPGRLVIIDAATREIEASLPLGANLTGMGRRGGQ